MAQVIDIIKIDYTSFRIEEVIGGQNIINVYPAVFRAYTKNEKNGIIIKNYYGIRADIVITPDDTIKVNGVEYPVADYEEAVKELNKFIHSPANDPDAPIDYDRLTNLPTISGVEVSGNKDPEDYNIQPKLNEGRNITLVSESDGSQTINAHPESFYAGQLKFGAMTEADRDAIPRYIYVDATTGEETGRGNSATPPVGSNAVPFILTGDRCEVRAQNLTCEWDGSQWNYLPHNADKAGDYWDIVFWYGQWIDGVTYLGDVAARITCFDATDPQNPVWHLLVYSDNILDGEVTDPRIGTRTLVDNAGNLTLVPVAAKTLTAWLQAIRDNIKGILSYNKTSKVYYVDGGTAVVTAQQDGSFYTPYKTFAQLLTAHGTETHIRVILKNVDSEDIVLDGKTGWTVDSGLASKDAGRVNVKSVTISGASASCYVLGLVINETCQILSTSGNNYLRYCTVKGTTTIGGTGYTCAELCSFEDSISQSSATATADYLSCQFEQISELIISAGVARVKDCTVVTVDISGNGALVFLQGSNTFYKKSAIIPAIKLAGTNNHVIIDGGICLDATGAIAPIIIEGDDTNSYSLGTLIYDRESSVIVPDVINRKYLIYSNQVKHGTGTVEEAIEEIIEDGNILLLNLHNTSNSWYCDRELKLTDCIFNRNCEAVIFMNKFDMDDKIEILLDETPTPVTVDIDLSSLYGKILYVLGVESTEGIGIDVQLKLHTV